MPSNPTNTPRGFHVETTWKRSFPRRFNMESTWCVCREDIRYLIRISKKPLYYSFPHFVDKNTPESCLHASLKRCLAEQC